MAHLITTALFWSFCAGLCRCLWVMREVGRVGAAPPRAAVRLQFAWTYVLPVCAALFWLGWRTDDLFWAYVHVLSLLAVAKTVWTQSTEFGLTGAGLVTSLVGEPQIAMGRGESPLGDPEFDARLGVDGDLTAMDWYLSASHRRAMLAFVDDGGCLTADGAVMPVDPWTSVSHLRERTRAVVAFAEQMAGIDPLEWLPDEPNPEVQRTVVLARVTPITHDARRFAHELLVRAGVDAEDLVRAVEEQPTYLALAAVSLLRSSTGDPGGLLDALARLERTDLEPLLSGVALTLRRRVAAERKRAPVEPESLVPA